MNGSVSQMNNLVGMLNEAKLSTESHFFFFCGGNIHAKGPAPVCFFLVLRVAGLPCATWIVFVGYLNGR